KTEEHPFVDIFNEDEAERNFLLSKPVCFVIFGKPSMLLSGHSIPDELVTKLMLKKLNSVEVAHFGYIITEIPSLSEEAMTILQQIEMIKNLNLKPDIIINIKCPDFDLCQRVSGQRQHCNTGHTYTRDQWDPEFIENRRKKRKEAQKERKVEEEGEEEEEQEEEEAFIAEMQTVAEILQHLVQRPEDYLENIEHVTQRYKEIVLPSLEEVMAEHNSQYLIELDGNKHPEDHFLTVLDRLKYLNLKRAAVITRLQGAEEEMSDILENDELFRSLASYKLIAPRYRWKRSRWGRTCPVSLKEGKIYCHSTEEALKSFSLNPRPYLLPPMPMPPCKIFIYGPQSSGRTTLSNLLAEHYRGKVIDYTKLVQPRFDNALEMLIKDTIDAATEEAIKVVKERLAVELQTKQQVQQIPRDPEKRENFDFQFEADKSTEEFGSVHYEDVLTHDSQRESLDNEESKVALESDYQAVKTDKKDIPEMSYKESSQDLTFESKADSVEDSVEMVTADHPEVRSMIEETIAMTKDMNFDQPYEKCAEILEEVLKEVTEENKNRFYGAPTYGGWILDNCPAVKELWTTLNEKGIVPDLVIVLSNAENNGKYLLNRTYLMNKSEIDSSILERLLEELQKKKKEEEAARKATEEARRLEEQNQRLMDAMNEKAKEEENDTEVEEEIEGEEPEVQEIAENPDVAEETKEPLPEEPEVSEVPEPEPEPEPGPEPSDYYTVETEIPKETNEVLETEELLQAEVVLPEFPEDAYPDVPEMEPFKNDIKHFMSSWSLMEAAISESFIQILNLEIADKSPEELLQKVIETMEKPFQYAGWELTIEDYDEETEDYQAEAEVEEDLEEEEEEEEENEDKMKEKKRHLGDSKHFCPVVLKENFILQPGNVDEAVKYRENIYYFSTPEAKEKFLEHPEEYVAHEEPLKAPPLRICLLGPHGSGKTVCGRQLAEKLGIFHIQFEEFLQEKLMVKLEKKVGLEYEEESEEEQSAKEEIEELALQANVPIKDDNPKKPTPEVQLTEEEEAIKASIMENESLPPEILETFLSEWWLKEPIRSTGFILDGFPRHLDEIQFLGEHGFFPDAAVFIQVDDQDISDRLLPSQIQKWKLKQKKKLERKNMIKEIKAKIKKDMIAKRRAELIAERESKRKEFIRDDDEFSEEEREEDDDDIENILEDEFPKDEEAMSEEEEEQEIDAFERLRSELVEKFEADMNSLQMLQEEFEKFLIPVIFINGSRKSHIVQYTLNMKLKSLVENRASIFEKCYPITTHLAQKMLSFTYKYTSAFGYWDPVKLSEGETIKPIESPENPLYPVIHRHYIYFLSSKETREKFIKNPIKYIRQPKPKPAMPIRIAVVGPPKSGKTTVAQKLASQYGLKRVSVGDALRNILNNQPDTELAIMLKWHLHKGMIVPDELAVQALEISLMESICNTAGAVIDGYPVTNYQVSVLEARSIIPMIIFELDVPSKEIFKRLILEKKKGPSLPYPLHNSAQIIAVKNSKYNKNINEIRQYYEKQHQNWYVIDGFRSKWWVWNEVIKNIQMVNSYIQIYLERIKAGKAALIDKLCITPQELTSRLGEFGQFCPVSLAESYELVDCSETESLEFAAEFRGHYYKMSSQEKLNKFLENPELYVAPLAPHPLPSANMMPKKLTLSELKSRFPKCAELQGYCPVTYQDGKQRQVLTLGGSTGYEALVPGNINYALEYRDHIYICESREKLEKFLRFPLKYWNQKLPYKLPPLKEPIPLTSLPLPGYLEQGTATSLIKAMNAAGCIKPKFPFLSVKRSVLLFIAFHLKAFNPKGSEYSRKKYKKKMELFVERCELITYLSAKMTKKYKEPQFRAIDFDHKLQTFVSLRNIDPVNE
ncbi:Adenylate kinase 9, partial [Galemys pyrenaicus]